MRRVKARKSHACDWCRKPINAGEVYFYQATIRRVEDGFWDRGETRMHEKCRERLRKHRIRKFWFENKVMEKGEFFRDGKWLKFGAIYDINDVAAIHPKRGKIVVESRQMVTDDPFEMHMNFRDEYEFRIGGDQ